MSKRLLVTGGAGFIGSHVAELMQESGWQVTVWDDLSSGRRENLQEGIDLVVGDIRSEEFVRFLGREDFDAISHHAAQMDVRRSVADPVFDAETNVLATIRMLEAVRDRQPHLVFASTGGAIYGEPEADRCDESHPTRPLSPYGCSKLAAEAYLGYYAAEFEVPVTILRYANVYGPRQNPHGEAGVVAIFAERLFSNQPCTIHGDGGQTRDYVHVGDVAAANRAAFESGGTGIFNVGTGSETSVVRLYQLIRNAAAVDRDAEHGPGKPGEQRRSVVDPSRLLQRFGLKRPRPLEEGITETIDWFRRQAVSGGVG